MLFYIYRNDSISTILNKAPKLSSAMYAALHCIYFKMFILNFEKYNVEIYYFEDNFGFLKAV